MTRDFFDWPNGGDPPASRAQRGRRFTFHGAFATKAKAQAKERTIDGAFIRTRTIKGKRRYVVMTPNA